MSDSSRAQLFMMEEVSWGVIPATALKTLRFTGESLDHEIQNTQSQEIRSDRQITDLIQVGMGAVGGFNFELSATAFDDVIEGAMMSDWGTALTDTGTTFSAAAADNSFNDSGAGFENYLPGAWIKVSGFATGANNGYFQVVSRTASKVVVSGGTLVNESAGPTVTIKSTHVQNSTTAKSYVVEKLFADKTKYVAFTGMMVSAFNLNIAANAIITGSVDFMGKSANAMSGSSAGTGAATAAPTNPVLSAVTNVGQVFEGGAALGAGIYVREISIQMANNLRPRDAIGNLGHVGVGLGSLVVTGTMIVYFEDETLYNKFRNGTASSFMARLNDGTNDLIVFMPQLKYTSGRIMAGGINQDVVVEMGYQAIRHPTLGFTIGMDRFS